MLSKKGVVVVPKGTKLRTIPLEGGRYVSTAKIINENGTSIYIQIARPNMTNKKKLKLHKLLLTEEAASVLAYLIGEELIGEEV